MSTETTKRILKAVREKKQITYKVNPQNQSRIFNRNIKTKKTME
jgi:flagellar biosynthesis/type III secretory pathway protein FliH